MKNKFVPLVAFFITVVLSSCSSHYRQMPQTRLDTEEFETNGTARLIGPAQGSASSYYLLGIPLNSPNKEAKVTTYNGRAMTPGAKTFSFNPLHAIISPILIFIPSDNALIGGAYYDAMESVENADVLAFPKIYRTQSNYFLVSYKKVEVEGKALQFVPAQKNSTNQGRKPVSSKKNNSRSQDAENHNKEGSNEDSQSSSNMSWQMPFEEGQKAFNNEQYSTAENHFQTAVKINPEDGFLKAWLATTQYRLGKIQLARENAQKALQQNPQLESAQQIVDLTE